MKYLGIDYGSKRIGLATSDREGRLAFPKENISNEGLTKTIEKIGKILEKEDINVVIVGHSANFRGKDNPIMREVRQFADEAERRLNVEVFLEPEFMTSIQAGRITGQTKNLDAQAAAIILQSYLDRLESNSKS